MPNRDTEDLNIELLKEIRDSLIKISSGGYSDNKQPWQMSMRQYGAESFSGVSRPERNPTYLGASVNPASDMNAGVIKAIEKQTRLQNSGEGLVYATMAKMYPALGGQFNNLAAGRTAGAAPTNFADIITGRPNYTVTRGLSADQFFGMQQQMIAGRFRQGNINMAGPEMDVATLNARAALTTRMARVVEPFMNATGVTNPLAAMQYMDQLQLAGPGGLRAGNLDLAEQRATGINAFATANFRTSRSIVEGMLQSQAILQPAMGQRDVFTGEYGNKNMFEHLSQIEEQVTVGSLAQGRTGDLQYEKGLRSSLAGLRALGLQSTVGQRTVYQAQAALMQGGPAFDTLMTELSSGRDINAIAGRIGGKGYEGMTQQTAQLFHNVFGKQSGQISNALAGVQLKEFTNDVVTKNTEDSFDRLKQLGNTFGINDIDLDVGKENEVKYNAMLGSATGNLRTGIAERWRASGQSIAAVQDYVNANASPEEANRIGLAGTTAMHARALTRLAPLMRDDVALTNAAYKELTQNWTDTGQIIANGKTRTQLLQSGTQADLSAAVAAEPSLAKEIARKKEEITGTFKQSQDAVLINSQITALGIQSDSDRQDNAVKLATAEKYSATGNKLAAQGKHDEAAIQYKIAAFHRGTVKTGGVSVAGLPEATVAAAGLLSQIPEGSTDAEYLAKAKEIAANNGTAFTPETQAQIAKATTPAEVKAAMAGQFKTTVAVTQVGSELQPAFAKSAAALGFTLDKAAMEGTRIAQGVEGEKALKAKNAAWGGMAPQNEQTTDIFKVLPFAVATGIGSLVTSMSGPQGDEIIKKEEAKKAAEQAEKDKQARENWTYVKVINFDELTTPTQTLE